MDPAFRRHPIWYGAVWQDGWMTEACSQAVYRFWLDAVLALAWQMDGLEPDSAFSLKPYIAQHLVHL